MRSSFFGHNTPKLTTSGWWQVESFMSLTQIQAKEQILVLMEKVLGKQAIGYGIMLGSQTAINLLKKL